MIDYVHLKKTVARQMERVKQGYRTCPHCFGYGWGYARHGAWIIVTCPHCKGTGWINPGQAAK